MDNFWQYSQSHFLFISAILFLLSLILYVWYELKTHKQAINNWLWVINLVAQRRTKHLYEELRKKGIEIYEPEKYLSDEEAQLFREAQVQLGINTEKKELKRN